MNNTEINISGLYTIDAFRTDQNLTTEVGNATSEGGNITAYDGNVFMDQWNGSSVFILQETNITKYEPTERLPWQLPNMCDGCVLTSNNKSVLVQTGSLETMTLSTPDLIKSI